ncbi:cell division cycle protein 27 homolog B [Herrania umbratica]|uniref:Cell division cycle protein 27 homolog B n=1 Tax=Herrania umbratica TaxID=108875 RepID=A0A6J1B634_9ROSI|nr:cell division cycle protein 27 homolog B [Herrania umbratica]
MEALLASYVENSLNNYMGRNAIFLCERLYAEFPSEVNLQLLARCYLNNNQAHSAYHILKGMQMAQSRYLFALACLEMDLFGEAEAALLPIEELSAEVSNGAAVQYLLGIIYWDTDRMKSSVEHFRKALSVDPLFWAAYEELCILGEAEEATIYFGDAAVHYVQEHYLGNASSFLQIAGVDQSLDSSQTFGLEDLSLRRSQQMEGNNIKDICHNNHGRSLLTGPAGQITNSCCKISVLNTPSPLLTQLSDMAPAPPIRDTQRPQSEGFLRSSTQAQRKLVHVNESAQVVFTHLCRCSYPLYIVLQRSEEALEMMEKAIVIDNKNPLPKYNKAKMLVTLGKLNEALEILEELKECTPHESSIYALIGEIYKQHKKYDKAMLHFGIALDLKPSTLDVAKIEAAIEKLIIPDEIEDDF